MFKKVLFIISLFVVFFFNAQSKYSIDPSFGIIGTSYVKKPGFNYLSSNLSFRYMVNNKVGFSGNLGIDNYHNKKNDYKFLIGVRFRMSKFEKFNTHSELGGGLTYLKNKNNVDRMFNINLGLVPQYKLSEKITLQSYVGLSANLQQNNYYDWSSLNDFKIGGGSVIIRFGISYNLRKETHVDWYHEVYKMDDYDNDGIVDSLDKCPKLKGIKKYCGCTENYINNPYSNRSIDTNLFFKDSLTKNDYLTIDTISEFFKLNSDFVLTIKMKREFINNAKMVRAEFVKRGINPNRFRFEFIDDVLINVQDKNGWGYYVWQNDGLFNVFDVGTGEDVLIEFYTVQVCAYKSTYLGCDLSPYFKYGKILISKSDEWVRHSVGIFKTEEEAISKMIEIDKPDAFVTMYKDGKVYKPIKK